MKGLIFALAMLGIAHTSFAQDTIYVDKFAQWTTKEKAVEYAVPIRTASRQLEIKFHALDGTLRRIECYSTYNANQKIRDGKLVQYYPNGKIRREEYYDKDHCTKGSLWAENGEELPFKPYYEATDFPGGPMKFAHKLATELKYPQAAIKNKLQGVVVLQFVIDTNGRVINPKVLRSAHPVLDNAALETLKKIAQSKKCVWTPAKVEGKATQVQYIVPAKFRLP